MTKTNKEIKAYAEYCMIKLLSVKKDDSDMSEISSYDLYRIKQILK